MGSQRVGHDWATELNRRAWEVSAGGAPAPAVGSSRQKEKPMHPINSNAGVSFQGLSGMGPQGQGFVTLSPQRPQSFPEAVDWKHTHTHTHTHTQRERWELTVCLFYIYTLYSFFLKNVYLFIWLFQVSVAACGIYFPEQGSNLGPPHWECRILATGPPGSPKSYILFGTKWGL